MKKTEFAAVALMSLLMTSCGGLATGLTNQTSSNTLNTIVGALSNGEALTNALTSVVGLDKPTAAQMIGTWHYKDAGVAFDSENALAKAGGEVVAAQVKQKLTPLYSKVGISNSNTYITFNSDGTFTAKVGNTPLQGTYTYDESKCLVTMKTLLLNLSCYAKKNSNGISLLFESKKLLTVLQTMSAMSGNTTVQSISEISKNYSGIRLGFEMTK